MNQSNHEDGEHTIYEKGVIKCVFNIKDKMREGLFTIYHPNSQIQAQGNYTKDKN